MTTIVLFTLVSFISKWLLEKENKWIWCFLFSKLHHTISLIKVTMPSHGFLMKKVNIVETFFFLLLITEFMNNLFCYQGWYRACLWEVKTLPVGHWNQDHYYIAIMQLKIWFCIIWHVSCLCWIVTVYGPFFCYILVQ